jgi:predicted DNA-binding protein
MRFLASSCKEFAMAKQKKPHAPMIRLDAELYERVETLAKADRRPVATQLKLVIAAAIGTQSSGEAAAA